MGAPVRIVPVTVVLVGDNCTEIRPVGCPAGLAVCERLDLRVGTDRVYLRLEDGGEVTNNQYGFHAYCDFWRARRQALGVVDCGLDPKDLR